MIKVLLTGANGQVGSEIKRAVPDFVDLISLDKQALDITSMDAIQSAFAEYKPDYVINAAAYTAVDRAEKEPELAYAINATGVLHLADECHRASIPLIHLSTDYVFNGNADKPYRETDLVAPLGVYGKSKWEGEVAVRHALGQHIILRTSWVFGCVGNNFVKTMLRLAKEQETLRVVSDQYGCPTVAGDIAQAIWNIIRQINQSPVGTIPWGTYHFANAHDVSWYEFACKIVEVAKKYMMLATKDLIPIASTEYPTLAKRPAYSVLNCQKIEDCFHIKPRHWEKALSEVIGALATHR